MGTADFFQRASKFLCAFALFALLPSVISLVLGIWSAASTGHVTVISLGKTETVHALVPWWKGWARFASTPVLLAALYSYFSGDRSTLRVSVSMLLAVTGIGLLCFSLWFTSVGYALFFYSFFCFLLLVYFVDARFGWAAATTVLVAFVCGLLCVYAAA